MGLFNFFKKPDQKLKGNTPYNPYRDEAANLIYNLLFCDNLDLYKSNSQGDNSYPFNILFSDTSTPADLQKLIDDGNADPRVQVLAYNRQRALGHMPNKKELLAVIVEVGMDEGLDVLASFANHTARYINHTGKILIWETDTDVQVKRITKELFAQSLQIVESIGPWDQPRRPQPKTDTARISFLVSDGLYFGEGPTNVLFKDQMAAPALQTATRLMQYITSKSLENQKND
jgi:hypothetical protein